MATLAFDTVELDLVVPGIFKLASTQDSDFGKKVWGNSGMTSGNWAQ